MNKDEEEKYDRVTRVLSPFSGLGGIDPEVVKNAADRGKIVHQLCNAIVMHLGIFDMEDMIQTYSRNHEHFEKEKEIIKNFIRSFEKWAIGKKIVSVSQRVFDEEFMLTGEYDLIYQNDVGERVLFDIKTPARESHCWLLQGSAYSYMISKKEKIDHIEFGQLSRDGREPKIREYKENFPLFLNHLECYRYSYKNKKAEDVLAYL